MVCGAEMDIDDGKMGIDGAQSKCLVASGDFVADKFV